MTEVLLPCPFCGGDELSHGWSAPGVDGSATTGEVQCHACDLILWKEAEDAAIAAWNHRTAGQAELAWQPIETAPKDGTEILLWLVPARPSDMTRKPKVNCSVWSGEVLYAWQKHHKDVPEWMGWVAANGDYMPTHWMALPSAPELAPHSQSKGEG